MNSLNIKKYSGRWYCLARVPNIFNGDAWFIPGVPTYSYHSLYPKYGDSNQVTIINESRRTFRWKFLEKIFSTRNLVHAEGHLVLPSSFKVFTTKFQDIMSWITRLGFKKYRSVSMDPEKPNLHVKKVIENSKGEYEYSILTVGQNNDEPIAWVMTKRHPNTFESRHFETAEKLIREVEEMGYRGLILNPVLLENREKNGY